jgi:hypothetical protein
MLISKMMKNTYQNMVFVAIKEGLNKNVSSSSTHCVPPWEQKVPMNGKKVVE